MDTGEAAFVLRGGRTSRAGESTSSASVFQPPHSGHRPNHFGEA
jgi:hypothetical protein